MKYQIYLFFLFIYIYKWQKEQKEEIVDILGKEFLGKIIKELGK